MFIDIAKEFLALCQKDPKLTEFAQKRSISTQFVITDQNLEFNLAFIGGEVKTCLGAPEQPADFTVKMTEQTFQAIMTGKMDPMSAAMSGKVHYKGNTAKGMLLQNLFKDLIRLYTQASAGGA